jgi:methylmalonyl-CoA/ethylmalonyl-CoA epimerase
MSGLVVPKIRIGEIIQIGIVVRDIQKAVENYWTTLGVGPWRIYKAELEVTVRGKPMVVSMRGAFAQSGPVQLELMELPENPSILKEFLEEKGEGFHHVKSRVEDPDGMLAAFKEMGVGILMSGKVGDNVAYFMDTEPLLGIIYEFEKKAGAPMTSFFSLEGTYPP